MEAVSGVLSRLFRQLGLEQELRGWEAMKEWPGIVGERIARHTRCVGFRQGTLRVEVEGSAWMQELKFLERELVRRINEHLGCACVRQVRFLLPRGGTLR